MPRDRIDDDTRPIPRVPDPPAAARRRRPPTNATRTQRERERAGERADERAEQRPTERRTGAPPGRDHNQTHRHGHGHSHSHSHGQDAGHSQGHSQSHGHSHGHGHGHGPAAPASRRVRTLLLALLAPLALAAVVGVFLLYPWGEPAEVGGTSVGVPVTGDVTSAQAGPCLHPGQVQVGESPPDDKRCLTVEVTLSSGAGEGTSITKTMPIEPSTPRFAVGDAVVLSYSGTEPQAVTDPNSYQIQDFQRGTPLLVLAGLFALAVLALGRRQGLAALAALALSFAVLTLFVLPAVLAGRDPLLVAIAGAGVIMFVGLYLTHGLSARTSVAVLGTLVSLALIGVISAAFSALTSLTGLGSESAALIASLGHGIDTRGLLLAGVVIGALGVLDDVTVTQASAVWELRKANPALGWRELYTSALRIGRDHVGSAVNTLVLAYAGAALPVLLLSALSGVGLGFVLGSQDIAQEIVRTLAGSIGVVASVPVTTLLASLIAAREPGPAEDLSNPIG